MPLHTKDDPTPGCTCWGCVPHDPKYRKGPSVLRSDSPNDYGQGFNDGVRAEADRQETLRLKGLMDLPQPVLCKCGHSIRDHNINKKLSERMADGCCTLTFCSCMRFDYGS